MVIGTSLDRLRRHRVGVEGFIAELERKRDLRGFFSGGKYHMPEELCNGYECTKCWLTNNGSGNRCNILSHGSFAPGGGERVHMNCEDDICLGDDKVNCESVVRFLRWYRGNLVSVESRVREFLDGVGCAYLFDGDCLKEGGICDGCVNDK